jgi:transcriptional regulator of heat shock response
VLIITEEIYTMELTERKLKILQAIITDFIASAEPVGSRTLAKKYNLELSPATIRNEMSDLEDMGYLTHPHASAGRVPSDKAYRIYVNSLMDRYELADAQKDRINQGLSAGISELRATIKHASEVLSELTNLTSFATVEDRSQVDLILKGMTRLFSQPEYNSVDKARHFLELVDNPDHLTEVISKRGEGITITIGDENSYDLLPDSSIITATYHIDGKFVGKLGVIGPTRMHYSEVMSVIEYLSNNLDAAKLIKGGEND